MPRQLTAAKALLGENRCCAHGGPDRWPRGRRKIAPGRNTGRNTIRLEKPPSAKEEMDSATTRFCRRDRAARSGSLTYSEGSGALVPIRPSTAGSGRWCSIAQFALSRHSRASSAPIFPRSKTLGYRWETHMAAKLEAQVICAILVAVPVAAHGATRADPATILSHAHQILIAPIQSPPPFWDFPAATRTAAHQLGLDAPGASGTTSPVITAAGAPVAAATAVVGLPVASKQAKENTSLNLR